MRPLAGQTYVYVSFCLSVCLCSSCLILNLVLQSIWCGFTSCIFWPVWLSDLFHLCLGTCVFEPWSCQTVFVTLVFSVCLLCLLSLYFWNFGFCLRLVFGPLLTFGLKSPFCWLCTLYYCIWVPLFSTIYFSLRVWVRCCGWHCAQVMNDQQWVKYTAITSRQTVAHSGIGQKIYHSIVRGFYQECFLLWRLIYFPIFKSQPESAFDKCQC